MNQVDRKTLSTTHSPQDTAKFHSCLLLCHTSPHFPSYSSLSLFQKDWPYFLFPKCIKVHSVLKDFTHAVLCIWNILPFSILSILTTSYLSDNPQFSDYFSWKPSVVFQVRQNPLIHAPCQKMYMLLFRACHYCNYLFSKYVLAFDPFTCRRTVFQTIIFLSVAPAYVALWQMAGIKNLY